MWRGSCEAKFSRGRQGLGWKIKGDRGQMPGATGVPAIGSPVGGPHSAGGIKGAAAVGVLSRVFAFAAHGGALGWEWS